MNVNHGRIARALSLLAAALLLAPSSASAQSRAEQLLSDRPPLRRGCTISSVPNHLPPLSQLADSAALVAAVAEFARQHPISERTMFGLYTVAFNAQGAVARVKHLEYFLPQGRADEFEEIVRRSLRPQAPGRAWSVRLRVEPAGNPVVRVGRSEVCEPESNTRFSVEWRALEGGSRPASPRVRAYVDAEGNVGDVQLLRGTGNEELDRWVQDSLRRRRYLPGLVDGEAVPMEKEEIVLIRSRG